LQFFFGTEDAKAFPIGIPTSQANVLEGDLIKLFAKLWALGTR